MLAELIARHEDEAENGNGNGKRRRARQGSRSATDEEEDFEEEADPDEGEDGEEGEELDAPQDDPGAVRRFRFRHPTASGKTIAAGGFVEAARTMGVLILTHRRLLVDQFTRDLTTEGYGDRLRAAVLRGPGAAAREPAHDPDVRVVRAPRRLGLAQAPTSSSSATRRTRPSARRPAPPSGSLTEPIYIGMTATEQLIAKQVSDVFPASVDDLPLGDAARRGLIAPLRSLRVRPAAAISSVPIVGGDYDQEILAKVLDQEIFNQAAASLYRDRFAATPGIVYAAGVEHAYNLAREFRAAGLKAEAVSGRTPPVRLAETLAAYERGEINILINAQLLAEGWNSPRATICMHLAPTASRRVYQQRIGRIMRLAPRKEAGIVIDFVDDAATHNDRTITIHSLLDSDFYRPGARVTPAPRRRDPAARETQALARALARARDARPAPARRGDHARVGARRPGPPCGRRAAPVGAHRRPTGALRGAPGLRREARPRQPRVPRGVPHELRGREPEPPPAPLGPRRPRRGHRRPCRLRRPRHDGDLGARPGRRTASRACACSCARSARGRSRRP